MKDKLLLIDGYSILHRAFYGIRDLTNAEGIHTNAIYGFLNIMFRIMDEEKPTHIAVAFDLHGPTFRHEKYAEYKAGRSPMPDELRQQVPIMKDVLASMNISCVSKEGFEADDILGTLATNGEKAGLEVTVLSGDRDLLQIATDHIKVRIPKSFSSGNVIEDYYAKDLLEKKGVTPKQFIDQKALMGDSSDNIPGVPKVGEKTAAELISQFGSLDGIYEHLEEIAKKAVRESLRENRVLADLCLFLVTIKLDVPLDIDVESTRIANFYNDKSYELFKSLGLKNFLSRFDVKHTTESNQDIENSFVTVKDENSFKALKDGIMNADYIGVSLYSPREKYANEEESGQFSLFESASEKEVFGAICVDKQHVYFIDSNNFSYESVMDLLQVARDKGCVLCTYNVKKLYRLLALKDDVTTLVAKDFFDILLASYILNPIKSNYMPDDIALEHLGITMPSYESLFKKDSEKDAYTSKPDDYVKYVCYEAYVSLTSKDILIKKLEETDSLKLFTDIEMPVSYALYDMEMQGIIVKKEELKVFGQKLGQDIDRLTETIYSRAGHEFNINSPKQLGEILFDEMGLEGGKKTKTGYSTSAEVLEKLAVDNEFVRDILEYRTLAKLKSTYADGLYDYIGDDDRIHSTFNQTITATGRISSTEPNLQNIPTRLELGRQIRKVFVPKEGCVFVDADYSQIELRILAALSGDEELIECYRSDADVHRATAAKVFGVPISEVTDLQRRNAKAVNFGIVYGISSFGLSQDLSISRKEAQQYIDDYFKTYPGIRDFLENAKSSAKEKGYSVTYFGRRRPIPELKNANFMQRSFGERVAMNAPIQGTAADIMKIAMINVHDKLLTEGLTARVILQVHDELLVETPTSEKDAVINLLEKEMKAAATLAVSLEVSSAVGTNWYEAKD